MATAKKRKKKTAAAKSAAKKSTATKGRSATKKATTKKASSKKSRTLAKAPAKAAKTTKAAAKKSKAAKKSAGKTAAKKSTAKKPAGKAAKKTAGKAAAKKSTAKSAAAKKSTAKSAAAKKSTAKSAAAKKTRAAAAGKKPTRKRTVKKKTAVDVDAALFQPLTEGERADAVRVLTGDPRLSNMARVGRYRVIAVEPLAVKPPHDLSGRRLARVVIYDYATDRSIDGCADLDASRVAHLRITRAQPMLAREEETAAIAIALNDERVKEQLSLGEEPQVAMHYWSSKDTSISYSRRSAAVLFGRPDGGPSLIAVVDLLDNLVCDIVPATQW